MSVGAHRGGITDGAASGATPLLEPVRRWLRIDVAVLAVAGVQCFVLATVTDRWFAWTVAPPVSAAVLGAGYLGSIAMVLEAGRARRWVDARVVIVSTLVFATLTLGVTLVHLDRFHLDDGPASARAAAMAWLVVYVVVPPLVLWLLVRQRRTTGDDDAAGADVLARPARAVLVLEGGLLAVLGLVLLRGAESARFWPWRLSDLTARAISAWFVSLGVLLVLCSREREVARARAALHSVVAAAVLWIVAVVRFRDSVDWDGAGVMTVLAPAALVATALVTLATATPSARR